MYSMYSMHSMYSMYVQCVQYAHYVQYIQNLQYLTTGHSDVRTCECRFDACVIKLPCTVFIFTVDFTVHAK